MPDIKCSIKLSISGGPSWSIDHSQQVDAYDVVDLIIDPGTTDHMIQLQPGAAGKIALFAIQSSLYGKEITFKASDGTTDTSALPLLGPQMFGNGNVGLFDAPPQILKLSNNHPGTDTSKRARIQILVGRDATS